MITTGDEYRAAKRTLQEMHMATGSELLCRCGHNRAAHEHFRPDTDCALCERGQCDRFRRATNVLSLPREWLTRRPQ
jgi:hypothetical protein